MGDKTAISWTNKTYNPWQGCAKVSSGCDNCYMFRDKKRYGQDPEVVVRSSVQTWNKPIRWNKEAGEAGRKDLVFTCSWSDWFIKEADPWRDEAWKMIKNTPNLIYQILTKRPARILANLPADWGNGYPNVWIGVTAETQDDANRRIPLLVNVPAKIRFVSIEPQLDLVELAKATSDLDKLHWAIYGGESGDGMSSRPLDTEWIKFGLNECKKFGITAFVKQMGSCWARKNNSKDSHGADITEWPEDLRVQEFPMTDENDITIKSYCENFDKYIQNTPAEPVGEFKTWMDNLLSRLPENSSILELGSAFSRDAKYFREKGHKVLCTDVIPDALKQLSDDGFETCEFNFRNKPKAEWSTKFNAVFANAVFVHASPANLKNALTNLKEVLLPNGLVAFSVKNGHGEEFSNAKLDAPRYFYYYNKETIENLLKSLSYDVVELTCSEQWISVIAKTGGNK